MTHPRGAVFGYLRFAECPVGMSPQHVWNCLQTMFVYSRKPQHVRAGMPFSKGRLVLQYRVRTNGAYGLTVNLIYSALLF